MDAPTQTAPTLLSALRCIARDIAPLHADAVDREARFPVEVVTALQRARLLSAPIPAVWGGTGLTALELGELCAALAETCASSAMVLAMHYNQVASLVRHAEGNAAVQHLLQRIAQHEWLVASITSEEGTFGDTRRSICAIEDLGPQGHRDAAPAATFRLVKEATTGSYCAQADLILVTARRNAAAAESDQVLVALKRDQVTLTQVGTWDTLGMRGTCSPGFHVEAQFGADAVVPVPYAEISAQSMLPFAHILWSALWTGIASGAYAKAAQHVRAIARRQAGQMPPTAPKLAALASQLQLMRLQWQSIAREFDAVADAAALESIAWGLKLNHLKTSSADMAPQIVHGALQIVGIQGYKNDSPLSLGRAYRDALSAALMVSNERIHAKSASMLLVHKDH